MKFLFLKKKKTTSLKSSHFKKFVESKLEDNPKLYGGDNGNTQLVFDYFKEVKGMTLPKYIDSISGTLVRIKNKLLASNPSYDYREKNKGKLTPKGDCIK